MGWHCLWTLTRSLCWICREIRFSQGICNRRVYHGAKIASLQMLQDLLCVMRAAKCSQGRLSRIKQNITSYWFSPSQAPDSWGLMTICPVLNPNLRHQCNPPGRNMDLLHLQRLLQANARCDASIALIALPDLSPGSSISSKMSLLTKWAVCPLSVGCPWWVALFALQTVQNKTFHGVHQVERYFPDEFFFADSLLCCLLPCRVLVS